MELIPRYQIRKKSITCFRFDCNLENLSYIAINVFLRDREANFNQLTTEHVTLLQTDIAQR